MTTQNIDVSNATNDTDAWSFAGGWQNNNILNASGHFSGQGGCDIYAIFKVTSAIAQSSTITSAIFRQQAYSTDSTSGYTARVKLQKNNNATAPSSVAVLDARTFCSDKPSLSNISLTSDANYDIDITTAFQELINFTALAVNDTVLVTIEDQGSSSGVNRQWKSRENGNFTSLRLTYSPPAVNDVMTASAGSFTLTGVAALFSINAVHSVGAFTLTGVASLANTSVVASSGTFTLTGVASVANTTVVIKQGVTHEQQTFQISSGGTPGTNFNITASGYGTQGCSYQDDASSLTGSLTSGLASLFGSGVVTLTYTGFSSGNYHFTLDWQNGIDIPLMTFAADTSGATGSFGAVQDGAPLFGFTGRDATLLYSINLVCDAGAFTLTGNDADFTPIIAMYAAPAGANRVYDMSVSWNDGGQCRFWVTGISNTGTVSQITDIISWDGIDWNSFAEDIEDEIVEALLDASITGFAFEVSRDEAGPIYFATLRVFPPTYFDLFVFSQMPNNTGSVMLTNSQTGEASFVVSNPTQANLSWNQKTVCDAGAFTLTGQDCTFGLTRRLSADAGTFTLTGNTTVNQIVTPASKATFTITRNDCTFDIAYHTQLSAGAFTLTGIDAAMFRAHVCAAGAYTLTGNAAALTMQYHLQCAPRAFVLNGGTVGTPRIGHLAADTGEFTLTGFDFASDIVSPVSRGVFTLTGNAIATHYATTLTGAAAAFTLTGIAATLRTTANTDCGAGQFVFTGKSVVLNKDITFAAPAGAYALTGKNATLRYATHTTCAAAAFTLTGNAAALTVLGGLYAERNVFHITGQDAAFHKHFVVASNTGVFTLTGKAAALRGGFPLTAAATSYTLTGVAAAFTASHVTRAERTSFFLTGVDARLLRGVIIASNTGSFTLTGKDAHLKQLHYVISDVAAFTLTGVAARLIRDSVSIALTCVFNLTGREAILKWLPLHVRIETTVDIENAYSGAISVTSSYTGIIGITAAYSANVSLNGVDVSVHDTPFWINEPNNIYLRNFLRQQDSEPQSADAPYFSLVNPNNNNAIVGGIEEIDMQCIDAETGTYLGVAPAVGFANDDTGLQRDTEYVIQIFVDDKLYREIPVTAKVQGFI